MSRRLEVSLPVAWKIGNPDDFTGHQVPATLVTALAELELRLGRRTRAPDLAASLFAAVVDDHGSPSMILMASLVAWCYQTALVASPDQSDFEPRVLSGVQITAETAADFLLLTCPVTSEDGEITGLLNFSSPNLEVKDQVLDGFRDIAATARIVSTR